MVVGFERIVRSPMIDKRDMQNGEKDKAEPAERICNQFHSGAEATNRE